MKFISLQDIKSDSKSQTIHYSGEIIQTSDLNVVTKHSKIHAHSGTMGFPTVIKIF